MTACWRSRFLSRPGISSRGSAVAAPPGCEARARRFFAGCCGWSRSTRSRRARSASCVRPSHAPATSGPAVDIAPAGTTFVNVRCPRLPPSTSPSPSAAAIRRGTEKRHRSRDRGLLSVVDAVRLAFDAGRCPVTTARRRPGAARGQPDRTQRVGRSVAPAGATPHRPRPSPPGRGRWATPRSGALICSRGQVRVGSRLRAPSSTAKGRGTAWRFAVRRLLRCPPAHAACAVTRRRRDHAVVSNTSGPGGLGNARRSRRGCWKPLAGDRRSVFSALDGAPRFESCHARPAACIPGKPRRAQSHDLAEQGGSLPVYRAQGRRRRRADHRAAGPTCRRIRHPALLPRLVVSVRH
jgi:hypothetical protein